ncbi:MAG: MOSC domain-containing protein [Candidatus Thiodiazotropha sp. (ex Lucinoma borealis)]|nr:MOSC domain-containing protein [Candidatus Thiodiazotropha sp. (ex Lucinoma borealis)]
MISDLIHGFARPGRIEGIYLRPKRHEPVRAVESAIAIAEHGLEGDHSANYSVKRPGGSTRQVTLIQAEHLPVIASFLASDSVDPSMLRRNLVVSGLNLVACRTLLKNHPFELHIGDQVLLKLTGNCAPCSRMEEALGIGGYNAMRGHGGVTASIINGGYVSLYDAVICSAAE